MIRVQTADFDSGAEIEKLSRRGGNAGAIVSFTGLVREESGGEKLSSMRLEHFPGMTERELERIEEEAKTRWKLDDVTVIHRVGDLKVGERIVLVAVAAAHRSAAFEAAAFLMDYLKTRAPFWKLERRVSGEHWVEARGSDDEAASRWKVRAE